jgi:hypothetical protein
VAAGHLTEREARQALDRGVITRAVGAGERLQVDVFGPGQVAPGEAILLCSDGLHGMLEDEEIAGIVRAMAREELPGALIAGANAAGGSDNIAVAVVALVPRDSVDQRRRRRWRPQLVRRPAGECGWPLTTFTHDGAANPPSEEAAPVMSPVAARVIRVEPDPEEATE